MHRARESYDQSYRREDDLKLVQAITAGSLRAWHTFLELHSGLIFRTVRRHLYSDDEDEVRNVYVDILKRLYDGRLSMFAGKSSLAAWLIVFTRNHVFDRYRKRCGRERFPKGYKQLPELDQRIFRLFFVERLPLEIIIHTLKWQGYEVDASLLHESILRSSGIIDSKYMKRIDMESWRAGSDHSSAKALRFLVRLRADYEAAVNRNRPDVEIIEKETLSAARRLKSLLSSFPPRERKIIFYRFNLGWTAKRIADRLNLTSERRVYTIIDNIVNKLRRAFAGGDGRIKCAAEDNSLKQISD
jgi:RNA polymerase sigma factor (sigma-70 family)